MNAASKPMPAAADESKRVVMHKCWQRLLHHHLDALPRLFNRVTGFDFRVCWRPPGPAGREQALARKILAACKNAGASGEAKARCARCVDKELAATLRRAGAGHTFTCPVGVYNFWSALTLNDARLGVAVFQCRKRSAGHSERDRAVRLLRLILHDVVETSLAETAEVELSRARRALLAGRRREARLRNALRRALPDLGAVSDQPEVAKLSGSVVERMLAHIHRNWNRPVSLKELAGQLMMNPAYLSDLFSRSVGMPFKAYVTELRLQRADQLLRDSSKTISEVAFAVGFTHPDRFRLAYRQWAGIPPRSARQLR